jgi:hypothetical protein
VINKTLRIAVLLLAGVFISGCSDDDCPTCGDQFDVLFYCSAAYNPMDIGETHPIIGFQAWFVGDPVPDVSQIKWLEREVLRNDSGFPAYTDEVESAYIKYIPVRITLDQDTLDFQVKIPDSTEVVLPGGRTVPAGQSVHFEWIKSADAEKYLLGVNVFNPLPPFENYLDSTIYTTDTTFVLASEYVPIGAEIVLQVIAGIGKNGEPGDEPTYEQGRYKGFIAGAFRARFKTVFVI